MSVRYILFIEHSNNRPIHNLFILMTYSYLTILQLTKIQKISCDLMHTGADPEIFQRGLVLRRKILKEKCLLKHVSTSVHIKTRQTCNSFSLLPFQEDCLLFFCFDLLLSFIFEIQRGGGGSTPSPPPPPNPPNLQPFCLKFVKKKIQFF